MTVILEAVDLEYSIGDRLLLKADRLKVNSRDRIGIVGMNGAGKTTLMRILAGEIEPERGTVTVTVPIVHIPQFKPADAQLSGGEMTAAILDSALMGNEPLVLADEPTMHLDAAHTEELEKRLAERDGALVLISHDRAFLDKLCTHIWALENGTVRVYKGNYSDYANAKDSEKQLQQKRYEQYVAKKSQLEQAIRSKTIKAAGMLKPPKRMSTSESRLYKDGAAKTQKGVHRSIKALKTRLDRLEKVERPRELPRIWLDTPGESDFVSQTALRVEKLSAVLGGRTLWQNVSFALRKGSKTALIGPNGSGKTTLIQRIVAGGEGIYLPPDAKLGYFSQDLSMLDLDASVFSNVRTAAVHPDAVIRLILARLLFKGEDIGKPAGVLSGGERVRASLAKILLSDANVLILDEPTNFLDIPSLEALEEMIREYTGTVLFVSHDRRFVERAADQILAIENGAVHFFEGPFQAYMEYRSKRARKTGREELAAELQVVETRISEVLGKIGMAAAGRSKQAEPGLEEQFQELVQRRKQLQKELGQI